MNGAEDLPSIVVNVPEEDSEDEVMKAFINGKTEEDGDIDKFKAVNKLAPDDASLSGRR